MSKTEKSIVALATQSAEQRLRLNPVRQVRRLKRWATERGWKVVRGFYFPGINPTTKEDALTLAIQEAQKLDGTIVLLDGIGRTVVLKVMEEGESRNANATPARSTATTGHHST